MKIPERTLRISAASLLALLMMGTSYVLSGPNLFKSNTASAETTTELLKAYSTKDTDGDGLPDWQEALYGTDPNKAISNSFGISDGEAAKEGKLTPNSLASQLPSDQGQGTTSTQDLLNDIPGIDATPGSITDQFSKQFLQEVIQSSNGQAALTSDQQQQLVSKLFTEYTAKATPLFNSKYTAVSVHSDRSISLLTYAASVEQIMYAHDVSSDANQPIVLMDDLVEKNDESARPKLKKLASSYGAITSDLLALHVPPQEAAQHLALIRGFDSLTKATAAVVDYEKDPLGVMGALSIFQPSSEQVMVAIKKLAADITAQGEPAPGAPGAVIVNVARSTEAQ